MLVGQSAAAPTSHGRVPRSSRRRRPRTRRSRTSSGCQGETRVGTTPGAASRPAHWTDRPIVGGPRTREAWGHLLEKPKRLPPSAALLLVNPVMFHPVARSGDESGANCVRNIREDDRNRAGRLLGGESRSGRGGDDNVHLQTDKLGGKPGQSLNLPAREPILDGNVLTLDVPELRNPCRKASTSREGRRAIGQKPDAGKPSGRLGLGNER